ncbi:MAG TPA: choice-of-anchor D domain-containing protein [Gemmatirosa sp.]
MLVRFDSRLLAATAASAALTWAGGGVAPRPALAQAGAAQGRTSNWSTGSGHAVPGVSYTVTIAGFGQIARATAAVPPVMASATSAAVLRAAMGLPLVELARTHARGPGTVQPADASVQTINGDYTNTSTLTAGSGPGVPGTISINNSTFTQTGGGTLQAVNGGLVTLNSVNVVGGTLTTSGTGVIQASNSGSNFLTGVSLAGTLDLASSQGIERVQQGLTFGSGGTININANSILAFEGSQTLGGSGTVVFGATGSGNRLNIESPSGTSTLTVGANVTIRGQNGTIGGQNFEGGAEAIVNHGTITADVSGGTITIVNAPVANTGTLAAANGGTLDLQSAVTNTGAGHLTATNGGVVLLDGTSITGGPIVTSTGGLLRASNSGNNFANGTTLNGTIDLASSQSILRVGGGGMTLTAGSLVNVDANSILAIEGTQTLGGTGTIVFGAAGSGNRLDIETPGGSGTTGTLTIGPNVTIRGQNGTIGGQNFEGGANAIVNNGVISADVSGGTITIVNAPVTNNGTLQAQNGGTLDLTSNVIGNAGSQIVSGAGSTVLQDGVSISGHVNTTGGGSFRASNNGNNFFNAVTLNGALDLASAQSIERVTGGLTLQNNATITLNANSILAFEGSQTIGGTGTILLGATGSGNRLNIESPSGLSTLTVGPNMTIRGTNGTIGGQNFEGGAEALVNNGTISADGHGGTITIENAPVTNNGTLQAINGATLVLSSNVTGTSGSQLIAGAGSVIYQNGVTLAGQITTSGTGLLQVSNSGNNFLDAVTFRGALDLASNQAIERASNNLTLQNGATIHVDANSILAIEGTQTLGGTGTIVFGAAGSGNRLDIETPGGSGTTGTLTIGPNVTIRGQNGTIGGQNFEGGANALVNNGTISADVAGGTITIVNAPVTNNGTLQAQNGGTLVLNSNVASAGAGQLLAGNGSVVVQNGVTIAGQMNTAGTGVIQGSNSGSNFLNVATLNGALDLASNQSIERVTGGLTLQNNGTVSLNANSILAFEGSQTLGGTGTIAFGSTGSGNRFNIESPSGTGTLTIGPNVTIHGVSGTIGGQNFEGGAEALVNNGTINADGGGTIAIVNAPVTNGGVLRAQNGTLTLTTPLDGTGILRVDAAGVVNLTSGQPVAQGTLAIGAAGATLNNGTENITLTTDYTNASAGTGNSFDRHAGITGTGQILAGGNVAQAITGTGVTNGATTAATLTIGNVRVGANSYTYDITNTGTTGPALRGAIQTSVNGASLTDTRLSGTGVTASNYGPAAPGAGAAYTVTFTAANAGALAPLAGQSINLRSTYDNIADQKLNIVLGSGAAAYQVAQGQLNTTALNFGTVQVGQQVSQTLSFTNSATGASGYVEDLDVGFGQASGTGAGRISGTGSIAGLTAGSTNTSSMVVTVNTASAGTVNGAIGITYASAGAVNGVSNGLGVLALPGTSYGVVGTIHGQGTVVDQAHPVINTPSVNLGAARVGGAALAGTVSISNQATGNQQAALDATIASTAPVTSSGSITLLAPGATNTSALKVGLGTSTAGSFSGSATLTLVSDASNIGGCGSNCQMTLASQTVGVTGKVYTAAIGQVNTTAVDFGIVHVGDAVTARGLGVANGAAVTALNDVLRGGVSTSSAGFTAAGSVGALGAGASDNTSLTVGLNTASAGRFTGSATVALASHDADLADLALGTTNVALTGQVNNYAAAGFTQSGGAGSLGKLSATSYTLDFGNLALGTGTEVATLSVGNIARGFADFLNGAYTASGSGFAFGGFNPFTGLAAGGTLGGLQVSFDGATTGMFSEVITLNGYGTNASGYSAAVAPVTLTLRGTVGGSPTVTPEPGTWALVAAGLAGVGVAARRRRRAL